MKSRFLPLVGLSSLVVLVAGCGSGGGGDAEPTETPTRPTNPLVERDGAIRTVRMTSGRALTYVLPDTASQILCQTLDRDVWVRLLGSPMGRHPSGTPEVGCVVAGQGATVIMSLNRSHDAFAGQTMIGGRPASSREDDTGYVTFNVALTDDSLRPTSRSVPRDLLELRVIAGMGNQMTTDAKRELASRILDQLVPLLVKDGGSLPDMDDQGHVRYASTPLIGDGQFVDLPQPVHAVQLCTLLQEAPGIRLVPTRLDVDDGGMCRVQTIGNSVSVAVVYANGDLSTYTSNVGGRPAWRLEDKQYFRVRLRDDVPVDLVVSADQDAAGLAEKLVPLLLSP